MTRQVQLGFENDCVTIPVVDILPVRVLSKSIKSSRKYTQITASIREIGLVEPPVVARNGDASGSWLLLDGICAEAVAILKDKACTAAVFTTLRKMIPLRQIEAAELMVNANNYSVAYISAILAGTPQAQLVEANSLEFSSPFVRPIRRPLPLFYAPGWRPSGALRWVASIISVSVPPA